MAELATDATFSSSPAQRRWEDDGGRGMADLACVAVQGDADLHGLATSDTIIAPCYSYPGSDPSGPRFENAGGPL
jgi:hypothetical protein